MTAVDGTVVQRDGDAMELALSEAETEVSAVDGTVFLVLSEKIGEDAMELADVLVLPEVVVDVDSPIIDAEMGEEALSTPLDKIRKQARTAMA